MFGVHLGIDGGVEYHLSAKEPRISEAMTVFIGLETEDELLDHLERVDAGTTDGPEWLRIALPPHLTPRWRRKVIPCCGPKRLLPTIRNGAQEPRNLAIRVLN